MKKQVESMEARKRCGRFYRVMLREVKPEHVPDMIDMLWRFGHSRKAILVPEKGQWKMKMPHGYALVGQGPAGFAIEPPPGQSAPQAGSPDSGDHRELTASVPRLDDHDTHGVIDLCELARRTARPERDQVITQIFALNLDRCHPKALDAVDLLTYDLIVNVTE